MRTALDWLWEIPQRDEDARRQARIIIVLALVMGLIAALAIPLVLVATPRAASSLIAINIIGLLMYGVVIGMVRAGLVQAGGVIFTASIAILTLASNFDGERSRAETIVSAFFLVLPLIIAGLILRPILIWLVLAVNLIGLLIAWNLAGVALFATPLETALETAAIFLQVGTAFFVFIGGRITDSALRAARQAREEARRAADQLASLNASLEAQVAQRTADLQAALRDLEQRTAEQARLLAENEQQRQAIRELSTPLLPVRAATLVMPLIGALDSARIAEMQQRALAELDRAGARELLIDVTGVPVIDTQVAKGLAQLVDAARLMGARVILVGIRPEVAQTLVTLGVDWHQVRAFSTLEAALAMSVM